MGLNGNCRSETQGFMGETTMTYYSSWQKALQDFITKYGHNYKEIGEMYALFEEFEHQIHRNIKGAYFMRETFKENFK